MEKADSPSKAPWSVPVSVDDIPLNGLHREIDASPAIRAQVLALVAGLASVHDLPKLSAVFDLTRRGTKVHVAGHVSARVGQTCVVTLEPIESDVEEVVDVLFAPTSGYDHSAAPEIEVRLGEEPPEPLVGDTVDLGALATEFLVLGVNPHPRKPGAEFGSVKLGDDGPRHFAALEALKNRLGGGKKP
jgi:Large ribosomal RNA subunit accumulation protein YceD